MADELKIAGLTAEVLRSDGTRFDRLRSSSVSVEMLGRLKPDHHFASVCVEMLQSSSERFEKLRTPSTTVEMLGRLKPDHHFASVCVEALVRLPEFKTSSLVIEVLGQRVTETPPLFYDNAFMDVTGALPVPPAADIWSKEEVRSAWTSVVSKANIDEPISYSSYQFTARLAVLASPLVTISRESVPQVLLKALSPANLGDFPRPGDIHSPASSRTNVLLVLQSLDIPYIPSSGAYVCQNIVQVVQASPLPMHTKPADVFTTAVLTTQTRSMNMHRSYTRVNQMVSQAVVPANFVDHTVGVEHVGSMWALAAVSSVEPLPQSDTEVGSFTSLALSPSDYSGVQSHNRVKQVVSLALVPKDIEQPTSKTRVASTDMLALVDSKYDTPDSYIRRNQNITAVMGVVSKTEYPDPSVPTTAIESASVVQLTMNVPGERYPTPEEIYAKFRYHQVAVAREVLTVSHNYGKPISYMRVPQYFEYVTSRKPLPPPEEVAESGLKVSQVTQILAAAADYPDKDAPASVLTVSQVLEQVAEVAEYPNAHLPTSYAVIPQITQPVMCVDAFPLPEDMHRPLNVAQITQGIADTATYEDAWSIHMPIYVGQLVQHYASISSYPDKDTPQSKLRVSQVLEQTAVIAVYPDKDQPNSALRAGQVLEQVATVDPSLYVMPSPPRKHRVQVNCRFVY